MLDCKYFSKKDVDIKKLVRTLDIEDFKNIAKKLNRSSEMIQLYISTKKEYAHIKIPELFITECLAMIEERKKELELLQSKIQNT